ncbi:MAG: universal stress protein [Burkholderiales bacterium]
MQTRDELGKECRAIPERNTQQIELIATDSGFGNAHAGTSIQWEEGEHMFKHILIPTDGSAIGNKAAKAGVALAARLGARVTAYHGLEDPQRLYMEGFSLDPTIVLDLEMRARELAQKRIDAIAKLAKAAGVRFAAFITKADTAYEGIINIAKERKCDVIVMASHGRRGFSKLMMGSVTQKVLAHSTIPVMVYR